MNRLLLWGFRVTLAAITITACEEILPNGNTRKFAQIGFNLILLSEILRPFLEMLKGI